MKKRTLSLILALLLIFALLSGCSGSGKVTPTATPAATDSGNTASPTPEPVDETIPFKLPIVDEPQTLSVWRGWAPDGLNITSPADISANKWLAEQTNINIKWVAVSTSAFTEGFNLMLASQDYEDMIAAGADSYVGGVDKGIADEIYLDAAPYMKKYMPNFSAMRDANEEAAKMTMTDSGKVFIASILDDDLFVWNGPLLRTDWAKELGYDKISTYDDLHNFLTDLKNVKGIKEGLVFALSEETNYYGLTSGFGTSLGFIQKDGKVEYGPTNDGFREYLATLSKWYSEGLIWSNFTQGMTMDTPITLYGQNKLAYQAEGYYGYSDLMPMLTGKGGEVNPTGFVTKKAGDKNHLRLKMSRVELPYSIFVTSKAASRNVAELCFQWIDARFSEDIANVLCLGIEGVDWKAGSDGMPEYTADYITKIGKQSKYGFECTDRLVASRDNAKRDYIWNKANGTEARIDSCNIWTETADDAWVLPNVTLTAEEASQYSSIYTDIKTYVEEFVNGVIIGNTKLDDTTWSTFVNRVNSMGIDKCVGFYQAALDRYNAR